MKRETKFIFVTGGVLSSLGKGLSSAAIGALLEARGLRVNFLKLDPYLNVDPGTMNPLQHGEVYVTNDGAETDLDLGHYERFTHATLTRQNNLTAGRVYERVIRWIFSPRRWSESPAMSCALRQVDRRRVARDPVGIALPPRAREWPGRRLWLMRARSVSESFAMRQIGRASCRERVCQYV